MCGVVLQTVATPQLLDPSPAVLVNLTVCSEKSISHCATEMNKTNNLKYFFLQWVLLRSDDIGRQRTPQWNSAALLHI